MSTVLEVLSRLVWSARRRPREERGSGRTYDLAVLEEIVQEREDAAFTLLVGQGSASIRETEANAEYEPAQPRPGSGYCPS